MVEFVSANPTGPLHVGHGRQGALGDALSALLEANGWRVAREFYYNDAGAQIANLALSVQARARGIEPGDAGFPADGYRGEYIRDIASAYLARETVSAQRVAAVTGQGDPDDLVAIREFAVAYLRHEQDMDLQAFGVRFDNYFLESSLYSDGKVLGVVDALADGGQDLRAGRRALAALDRLRRRQGPRDAQVRGRLHLLRARRRLPPRQVAARLRQGDQRAGLGPPRHDRAGARRPAGARAWGFRRAFPTTCCTRW